MPLQRDVKWAVLGAFLGVLIAAIGVIWTVWAVVKEPLPWGDVAGHILLFVVVAPLMLLALLMVLTGCMTLGRTKPPQGDVEHLLGWKAHWRGQPETPCISRDAGSVQTLEPCQGQADAAAQRVGAAREYLDRLDELAHLLHWKIHWQQQSDPEAKERAESFQPWEERLRLARAAAEQTLRAAEYLGHLVRLKRERAARVRRV